MAYVNRESPLSEALLGFCVNQGISASVLSSILSTANSFLIFLYTIYVSRLAVHASDTLDPTGVGPG